MSQLEFWNEIGSKKDFSDPFFIEKLSPWLSKGGNIVEYGCGYGRLLDLLWQKGYEKAIGFDFAPNMLERGRSAFPHLDLRLIAESGQTALADKAADVVILSTVLCCNPDKETQVKILEELQRILVNEGVLYLCDFLITDAKRCLERYTQYAEPHQEDFGIYQTSEGGFVRHHRLQWIFKLLQAFDILWLEQFDGYTMNGNVVRTVHLIAKK